MDTAADFEDGRGGSHSSFGRWVIVGLLLSVLLHVYFWYWASNFSLHNQSEKYYEDRAVPRTFHIERAEIDPKLLEPSPAEQKSVAQAPQPLRPPQDKPAFEQLMADTKGPAMAPKIEQSLLSDKPTAAATTLDKTILTAQQAGAQSALQDAQSLHEALIQDKPDAGQRSMSDIFQPNALTGRAIAPAGQLQGGNTPGFSNLDELLAQTGPLSAETAPILMPTDLLFDYGSAALKPEALASLEKLGTLIQRNPNATFLIEGHTDTFGSDDFNQSLSQQRADGVKAWLVGSMRIPTRRIDARGLGKSRLLAPASGSIEEQKLNRRVEIVIRVPQASSAQPE